MNKKSINPAVREYLSKLGSKGGKRVTAAKKRANRDRILKYWAEVNAGIRKKPDHTPKAKNN